MKLLVRNSFFFVSLFIFSLGCKGNEYSQFYEKNAGDWRIYTRAIGAEEVELENTVLLVLKSSECSPSLTELEWWDEYRRENSDLNVLLIILEKYATTYQTFLTYEEIQIPAFRDSAGIIFDHGLLPHTPMKIYIDGGGNVEKIAAIGAAIDPAQDAFVEALSGE